MGTKEPMFDILESFNNIDAKAKANFKMPCVVFTQTDGCHTLIEEAFRFEGIEQRLLLKTVMKICVDMYASRRLK